MIVVGGYREKRRPLVQRSEGHCRIEPSLCCPLAKQAGPALQGSQKLQFACRSLAPAKELGLINKGFGPMAKALCS
jgi:hypothetical protein